MSLLFDMDPLQFFQTIIYNRTCKWLQAWDLYKSVQGNSCLVSTFILGALCIAVLNIF